MFIENAGVDEEVLGAGDDTGVEDEDARAPEDQEDSTDWAAVAATEKARADKATEERDNYKRGLTQKRQLRKGPKADQEDEEEQDEDERPLTMSEFQRVLQETVTPMLAGNKVDTILADKVKDPAKREAVRLIYENRVRQTGTSDEAVRFDIDAALAIADANRNRKIPGEVERIQNRGNMAPLNGSSNERGIDTRKTGFTDDQIKELTKKAEALRLDPEKFIAEAWKNSKKR